MSIKFGSIGLWGAALIVFSVGAVLSAAQEPDPVLVFYWQRAEAAQRSLDPLGAGISYSFRARTYYRPLGDDGWAKATDSSIADFYFSFGNLDSTRIITASKRKHVADDFSVPNVFAGNYDYYFYPNDTGGKDIALGFNTWTAGDTLPEGLAIIDRARYNLCWLYLYYPPKDDFKRYSRVLRFTQHEGFVFADSMVVVMAREGVFSTEHSRIETGISNIQIYR